MVNANLGTTWSDGEKKKKQLQKKFPGVVAEWSKTLISEIQVDNTVAQVPGSNPAWDLHAILRSKSLNYENNMKSTHMSGTGLRKQYMEAEHRGHHEFVTCNCV